MPSPKDTFKTIRENAELNSSFEEELTRAEEESKKADEDFRSKFTPGLWKEK